MSDDDLLKRWRDCRKQHFLAKDVADAGDAMAARIGELEQAVADAVTLENHERKRAEQAESDLSYIKGVLDKDDIGVDGRKLSTKTRVVVLRGWYRSAEAERDRLREQVRQRDVIVGRILGFIEAETSEQPIIAPGTNAAWDECARTLMRKCQALADLLVVHASDCATHNAPAYEPGLCDCGASLAPEPVCTCDEPGAAGHGIAHCPVHRPIHGGKSGEAERQEQFTASTMRSIRKRDQ